MSTRSRKNQTREYNKQRSFKIRSMLYYLLYILLTLDSSIVYSCYFSGAINRTIHDTMAHLTCRSIKRGAKFVYRQNWRYVIHSFRRRDSSGRKRWVKTIAYNHEGPLTDGRENISPISQQIKICHVLLYLINTNLKHKHYYVEYQFDTRPQVTTINLPFINNLRIVSKNCTEVVEEADIKRIGKKVNDIITAQLKKVDPGVVYLAVGSYPSFKLTKPEHVLISINGKELIERVKGYRWK